MTTKHKQLSTSHLAKEVGLSRNTVEKILEDAKVKPIYKFPAGRGFTSIYNRAEAFAAVAAHRQAALDKLAKKNPQAVPTPGISLTGIEKQLAVNDATVAQLAERVDELTRQAGLLLEQNKVLLAKLMQTHHYAEMLHTTLTPEKVE